MSIPQELINIQFTVDTDFFAIRSLYLVYDEDLNYLGGAILTICGNLFSYVVPPNLEKVYMKCPYNNSNVTCRVESNTNGFVIYKHTGGNRLVDATNSKGMVIENTLYGLANFLVIEIENNTIKTVDLTFIRNDGTYQIFNASSTDVVPILYYDKNLSLVGGFISNIENDRYFVRNLNSFGADDYFYSINVQSKPGSPENEDPPEKENFLKDAFNLFLLIVLSITGLIVLVLGYLTITRNNLVFIN